jgi:hypothetical protein
MKNLLIAVTLILASFTTSASSFVESKALDGFRLQIVRYSDGDYKVDFSLVDDVCIKDHNINADLGTTIINGVKIRFEGKCSSTQVGQYLYSPLTIAGQDKLAEIVENSDTLRWEDVWGVEVFDLKDLDKNRLKFRGGI